MSNKHKKIQSLTQWRFEFHWLLRMRETSNKPFVCFSFFLLLFKCVAFVSSENFSLSDLIKFFFDSIAARALHSFYELKWVSFSLSLSPFFLTYSHPFLFFFVCKHHVKFCTIVKEFRLFAGFFPICCHLQWRISFGFARTIISLSSDALFMINPRKQMAQLKNVSTKGTKTDSNTWQPTNGLTRSIFKKEKKYESETIQM